MEMSYIACVLAYRPRYRIQLRNANVASRSVGGVNAPYKHIRSEGSTVTRRNSSCSGFSQKSLRRLLTLEDLLSYVISQPLMKSSRLLMDFI